MYIYIYISLYLPNAKGMMKLIRKKFSSLPSPAHQSRWSLHNRWAVQTCHSSWQTPTSTPPDAGFDRIVGCFGPWRSCYTGRVQSRRWHLDCGWRRWWNRSVSAPLCSPAGLSSDGFLHVCRLDSGSVQSWRAAEWRLQVTYLTRE